MSGPKERRVSDLDAVYLDLQTRWDAAGIERATCAEEMSFLAGGLESLASRGVPGVVLECGAFTGFSSACLAIACHRHGRKLVVADSFAGLPDPGPQAHEYQAGQFSCGYVAWRKNVDRFCWGLPLSFLALEGYFEETLRTWATPVAMLWLDVDLGSSVRDVLRAVLPHLSPGALVFLHESEFGYFDAAGQIDPDRANEVWLAVREELGDRPYRAYFLLGCLAELELLPT